MIVCSIISIVALVIPILIIRKRSSKIETGLAGALGYGFLGYIWQYIIYMFVGLFATRLSIGSNQTLTIIVVNILLAMISTACTAVSLYWGIYLTNQKQLSLYRSAAVGIGFSLGKIGIDLIYPYLYSFYLALQINAGTFQADEGLKWSICNTTVSSMIFGTYKCLLMFVIIFAIATIMGHYYIQKNYKRTWLSVICIYMTVMILNLIVRAIFRGALVREIALMIVFTVIAVGGAVVLWNWFKNDEVEVNLLKIMRG